jgi:hypothetical protein
MARQVVFTADGHQLVMQFIKDHGRSYVHMCDREVFEDVAWHVHEHGRSGVSMGTIRAALPGRPHSQVDTAFAFLASRGCLRRSGQKSFSHSPTVFEDAMENFWHLAEVGT